MPNNERLLPPAFLYRYIWCDKLQENRCQPKLVDAYCTTQAANLCGKRLVHMLSPLTKRGATRTIGTLDRPLAYTNLCRSFGVQRLPCL
jgi:hypothetical protein